eukprot:jgi/Botrbrau1/20857/Bobra.0561s0002.1
MSVQFYEFTKVRSRRSALRRVRVTKASKCRGGNDVRPPEPFKGVKAEGLFSSFVLTPVCEARQEDGAVQLLFCEGLLMIANPLQDVLNVCRSMLDRAIDE